LGVRYSTLQHLHACLDLSNKKIKGSDICLLGHFNCRGSAKDYFREHGFRGYWLLSSYLTKCGGNVIEIDLGCPSSVQKDLGREIKEYRGQFDVVIDYGTNEHIDNQEAYWLNLFNFLKVGGVFIGGAPHIDSWGDHGTWGYNQLWFYDFMRRFSWGKIDFKVQCDCEKLTCADRTSIWLCLEKTPDTNYDCSLFRNPIYKPEGHKKDKKMYDRYVIPARA